MYNITCVLFAGFCAVEIIYYKWFHPGPFYCNDDNLVGPDNQRCVSCAPFCVRALNTSTS